MKNLLSKSFAFLAIAILGLAVPFGLSGKSNAAMTATVAQPDINAWGEFAARSVKRGGSVQGRVIIDIPNGYHTQSNKPSDKYLVATKLDLFPPDGVKVGAVVYPPAKYIAFGEEKKKLSVFEGRTTLKFNVAVPANFVGDKVAIKTKLRYQSCNDSECYPPVTKEVWATIGVN